MVASVENVWRRLQTVCVKKARYTSALFFAHPLCTSANAGFDKLVDRICSLINREEQWSPSLEKSIASAAPNFHSRLLFRVLKMQTQAHMACGLFHWASRLPNFAHTPFTYCALIEILARLKDFDQIWSLIHAMHASHITLSPVPFTTLINAYGTAGLVDDAQRAFDAISSFGCKPNIFAYNALLNAQMKAQKTMDAFNTFKGMRDDGCSPDVITYTSMITGLCNAGEVDKASGLMKDMRGNDCMPNTRTFTAMIQGLLRAEQGEEALSTLDAMVKSGCAPDTVTYNSLIEWFCCKGNPDKAMELFDQMTTNGCNPDVLTYGILVRGLFKARKAVCAVDMIKRMIEKGCEPDASTYNLLTVWLCTDATPEQAVTILDWFLSMHSRFSYVTLVDGLFKAKRMDLIFCTVKGLLSKGISPDKATCTAVINWLCKQGRTDEVVELLEKVTDSQAAETAACG